MTRPTTPMERKSERLLFPLFCITVLLALCLAGCAPLGAGDPQFLVTLDGADNQMTVTSADRTALLDVYSASGLGRASVRWVAGSYPAHIRLRLHLRGLEELRVTYAATVITLSIPSSGEFAVRQEQAAAGPAPQQAHSISSDSPYWMKTAIVGQTVSRQNPIPLTDGWIEVELPQHFFRGRYTEFAIQWVDFYR